MPRVKGNTIEGLTSSEREAKALFEAQGWSVFRNGWPDFLAAHPSGRLVGIEVKTPTDTIRPAQEAMFQALGPVLPVTVLYLSDGDWKLVCQYPRDAEAERRSYLASLDRLASGGF